MQKRVYNIENIRGVDITSSPINVASNRASYMINMISDGGVNKKRNGWKDIAWFEHLGEKLSINGIYKYNEEYIVHAKTRFYRCDNAFSIVEEILIAEGVIINNTKSKGYIQDDKLWITGAGDYLVYDGTVIQSVHNSEYAYIPTTSIAITDVASGDKREKFQGVNLFSNRRKNKLIGTNYGEGTGEIVYNLDGHIDMKEPMRVRIEFQHKTDLSTKAIFEASYTLDGDVVSAIDENGLEIDGLADDIKEKLTLRNSYECGQLAIKYTCLPILEGESNITVEYAAQYKSNIAISTSYQVHLNAGSDVLCLTSNRNIVYISDFLYGYGYFPDNDYVGIGKETDPITAIVPLDSGIGVFKSNEFYKVNLDVNIIDEEYIIKLKPSIDSFYPCVGCENEFCGLNVNGDVLIYNGEGVHGVVSSASKPVNIRSTNVNRELLSYADEERKGAFAVSHDGRYYLFVGGKVYIADTRYKFYESNRLDSGYEYEWWIWDNCLCRCAYSFDGNLYLGTEEGTIRAFNENYTDEGIIYIYSSNGDMVYDGDVFTFNERLKIKDGDIVEIINAYEVCNKEDIHINTLIEDSIACIFSETDYKYNGIEILYTDLEVVLYSQDTQLEIPCQVYRHVPDSFTVLLKTMTKQVIDPSLNYVLIKKPSNYTVQTKEEGTYLIDFNGSVSKFLNYADISAIAHICQPVCCEIRTGAINLGNLYAKTLYKLALTPSSDTKGQVEVGYETNLNLIHHSRIVGEVIDFNWFDFKKFVFDGAFFKTYIKRVFERNFNYIIFQFKSESNGAFGVANASVVYSINNEIRSDR